LILKLKDKAKIGYNLQLKKKNIISCCHYNILKIYEINNNNYNLIHILEGHNKIVRKVIELKDNKLISFSDDKTIKIWNHNYDKY
jgi:WD40 repeat protein